MLRVIRHGNKISVTNPANGSVSEMTNVVFQESGRSGAISSMSGSSDFLSRITGQNVGLDQVRIHTHPVKSDKIDLFPVGKEIPGHINRTLYSTPQLRQQENVYSRMVDGKPTFFTTSLDENELPDRDLRMDNSDLAKVSPESFKKTRVGAAETTIIEQAINLALSNEEEEAETVGAAAGTEKLTS